MAPTKIMIIRHAEKPEPGTPDQGVGPEGGTDPASLTAQGWERAKQLVGFFTDPESPGIATPAMIFACKPIPDSRRPQETVSLLADALWSDAQRPEHFNTEIERDDFAGLAAAVGASEGVCLICWEHDRIPDVAARFPHDPPSPAKWPGHRFDVVWVFDSQGDRWAFSQTPQNLLPGDEDKPIRNKDD
ncbi:MAG: histidine phosphatase family protein [Acetobacteraceae bacterium]|nr:histidine phosphatase family protein [Acetobacteraceae bacterium]